MTAETHFLQAGDGPILIGSGSETLACQCGNTLIQGFDAARFLAIGIQCARCGSIVTTAPLAEGARPPRSAIVAAPSVEPRATAMTVTPGICVIGQAEMERLQALFQPASPGNLYQISDQLLDEAAAAFERLTGATLPAIGYEDAPAGMRKHALGWAVGHLRRRVQAATWACLEDPMSGVAVSYVAGFLHFVATWHRHPLFSAMVTSAADRGFSPHGLAPFTAAHCMTMLGNRISFPDPQGFPERIDGFTIVAGADPVGVQIEVFDRFEFPFSPFATPADHYGAVTQAMGAAQARINLRNPGVLILSPGNALPGQDDALIEAIKAGMQSLGRKNRGLMAVAMVAPRLQEMPDPHSVRFGYLFFPVGNRHYRGDNPVRMAG